MTMTRQRGESQHEPWLHLKKIYTFTSQFPDSDIVCAAVRESVPPVTRNHKFISRVLIFKKIGGESLTNQERRLLCSGWGKCLKLAYFKRLFYIGEIFDFSKNDSFHCTRNFWLISEIDFYKNIVFFSNQDFQFLKIILASKSIKN